MSDKTTVEDLGDDAEFWFPAHKVLTKDYWLRILGAARERVRCSLDRTAPSKCFGYRTFDGFCDFDGDDDGRGTEAPRFERSVQLFERPLVVVSLEDDGEALQTFAITINAHPADMGDLVRYMQETSRQRRLFVGSTSGLGLVPQQAELEDEIWVLFRCPAPMTLRCKGGKFVVVGEAYVNGLTQAEAVRGTPAFVRDGDCFEGVRFGVSRFVKPL
ncbi:hypothetical protein MMC13_005896 [Lambiella insularis]|nr:hypothetical protein [Lambiella insularis]